MNSTLKLCKAISPMQAKGWYAAPWSGPVQRACAERMASIGASRFKTRYLGFLSIRDVRGGRLVSRALEFRGVRSQNFPYIIRR